MHEQSITFRSRRGKYKGQVVNTPGIHRGQEIDEDTADQLLEQGTLKPLGGKTYKTISEGVAAAKARSSTLGRELDRLRRKSQ